MKEENLNLVNSEVIVQEVDDFVVVNENGLIHVFDKDEDEFLLVKDIEDVLDLPNTSFSQYFLMEKAKGDLEENEDYFVPSGNLLKLLKSIKNKDNRGRSPYLIERSSALMVIACNNNKHSSRAKKILKDSSKLAIKIRRAYSNRGAEGALEIIESYVNNMENIIGCTKSYYNALKELKKCKSPITNDIRGLLKTEKAKSKGTGTTLTAEENLEYNNIKVEKLEAEIKDLAAILKPQLDEFEGED